jgi:hypothetical protein
MGNPQSPRSNLPRRADEAFSGMVSWSASKWILVCLALLGAVMALRASRLKILARELETEKRKLSEQRAGTVAQLEKDLQAGLDQGALEDRGHLQDPAWLSGAAPREQHQKKWALRLSP